MRRLPWTLYRYVGKEMLAITCVSLGALSLLFMIVSGIRSVNEGFDLNIVMPWIFESLGYSLFFTVPASLLVATTLCLGRFSADREYTATSAAGIAPLHIFAPIAVMSGALAAIALVTVGDVMPRAHYLRRNIARYLAKQLSDLGEGYRRVLPIEGGRVYCESHNGPLLHGVLIEKDLKIDASELDGRALVGGAAPNAEVETVPIRVFARTGKVDVDTEREVVRIQLDQIQGIFPNRESKVFIEHRNLTEGWDLMSSTGTVLEFPINEKPRRIPDDYSTSELRKKSREFGDNVEQSQAKLGAAATDEERRTLEEQIKAYKKAQRDIAAQIWFRYAIALSCFTFPFLGFSVSLAFVERHRLVPFFIASMLTIVIFYPLVFGGEVVARSGALPAPIAMLAGNAVLFAVACAMTGRLYLR
ncbi:MAG: LptF/LptG family permease [Planctomycetes bacterium]|nr:LptF/LptG family permease [Planctomycetota bacterium]